MDEFVVLSLVSKRISSSAISSKQTAVDRAFKEGAGVVDRSLDHRLIHAYALLPILFALHHTCHFTMLQRTSIVTSLDVQLAAHKYWFKRTQYVQIAQRSPYTYGAVLPKPPNAH